MSQPGGRGSWWIVLALIAVAAPPAHATAVEAQAHFAKGRAAFEAGNYPEAVTQFEAAYTASPAPEILWNIAQAHRRQYEIDRELSHLRRALIVYDNFGQLTTNLEERSEAVRERALIEEEIARREAKVAAPSPSGAKGVAAPSVAPAKADLFAPAPKPIYRRWWLWTAVVVVLAAGAATALALVLTRDHTPSTNGGDYTVRF